MAMSEDLDRTESAPPPLLERLGRYEIAERLGCGAMGEVYAAHDPLIHRDVVIKTVQMGLLIADPDRAELIARFKRECKLLGAISHPNVVAMYDAGEDAVSGRLFLVMEKVEGLDLQTLLKTAARLPAEQVQEIALGLARALEAAHARGIVHRDVKPSNILLAVDGTVKLTDFGIARTESDAITREGTVVGTPTYLSPEQLVGGAPLDGRADLFSLGIVLYQLLAGRHPFQGRDVSETCARLLHDEPVPIREVAPDTPPSLAFVVARLLAKRPDDRPRSATAVIELLRPERTEEVSTLTLGTVSGKRDRRVPLLIAIVFIPVALALGWGVSAIVRQAKNLFAPPANVATPHEAPRKNPLSAREAPPETPAARPPEPMLRPLPDPEPPERHPLAGPPDDPSSTVEREKTFEQMEKEYREFEKGHDRDRAPETPKS